MQGSVPVMFTHLAAPPVGQYILSAGPKAPLDKDIQKQQSTIPTTVRIKKDKDKHENL